MKAKIIENKNIKALQSENYNFVFSKTTGFFARWGKTPNIDPQYSPFGPEILDIEITTKCSGPGGKLCPFCYKSNTPNGKNMSFDTFKQILNKMPKTLTQVAFGADATAESNPDLWKMMEYCRSKEIVPNITVADISDKVADKLVSLCGAVAVSRYADKDLCYNSVKKLTDRGLKQTNIHVMISEETAEEAITTIINSTQDERLKNLNAIVLLSLKQKGRGIEYTSLSQQKFDTLVYNAFRLKVNIGFDSCGAHKFLESIKNHPDKVKLEQMVEPCESTAFSSYIDVNGFFSPCSFVSEPKLNVLEHKDFVKDIWNNKEIKEFREKLINCNRNCPIYKV